MKRKIAAIVGLAAIGIGAIALVVAPRGEASDTTYLTATVERGDVVDEVATTGSIGVTASYGLAFGSPARLLEDGSPERPSAQTTWPVATVAVAAGDRVTKDQVLATADTADLRADLEIATADWRAARADYLLAEADYEDAQEDGTTAEIRRARSAYYGALSRYEKAGQARDELAATIAGAEIRSPIDGIVTDVAIEAGLDAPNGDAMVVASPTLEVETDVVESDIAELAIGQQATITVDAIDAELSGRVAEIGLAAADASQTGIASFPVTIAISDAPAALREGMTADVTIATASADDVLSIPTAALESGLGGYTVLVLGADGVPVTRSVEVGLVTDSRAQVSGGLTEGETVVTGTLSERQGLPGGGTFVGPGGGSRVTTIGGGGGTVSAPVPR